MSPTALLALLAIQAQPATALDLGSQRESTNIEDLRPLSRTQPWSAMVDRFQRSGERLLRMREQVTVPTEGCDAFSAEESRLYADSMSFYESGAASALLDEFRQLDAMKDVMAENSYAASACSEGYLAYTEKLGAEATSLDRLSRRLTASSGYFGESQFLGDRFGLSLERHPPGKAASACGRKRSQMRKEAHAAIQEYLEAYKALVDRAEGAVRQRQEDAAFARDRRRGRSCPPPADAASGTVESAE